MRKGELAEILALHAEALNAGKEQADLLLARYPEQSSELAALLWLARSVQSALVPVKPRPAFSASLRQELARQRPADDDDSRRLLWWGAALGSALSVAGLVFLIIRRFWWPPAPPPAATTPL
jgi:hypothetical protein